MLVKYHCRFVPYIRIYMPTCKLDHFYHDVYVMGGKGIKACFVLFMYKCYMKAHKQACFHVFSPFSACFPPITS